MDVVGIGTLMAAATVQAPLLVRAWLDVRRCARRRVEQAPAVLWIMVGVSPEMSRHVVRSAGVQIMIGPAVASTRSGSGHAHR